jgi:RNA polymerase sigma-70 factor, ECF subfamily
MSSFTDEELVARYQEAGRPAGTPFADELFQRHYSKVALWCLRLTGDRDMATDLAQEVFVKAWGHLEHFRGDSKFSTWLFMIARNHCFNTVKKLGRNLEDAVEREVAEQMATTEAGFDAAVERREMLEAAREMMARELTPIEAQVMTLHYVEELPLPTISRMMRLENASGAKAFVVSAKRKLKSAVDRWRQP